MLLQDRLIDYLLLGDACKYYAMRGYTQVEVPWIVEKEFSQITAPVGFDDISFALKDDRRLVCSAEQGFFQKKAFDDLPYAKYFAVSPCFRDEELDETHSKWFVKLELYFHSISHPGAASMMEVFLRDAKHFFDKQGAMTRISATDIGVDLISGGLEVGSYGIRQTTDGYMAYGTGLALPRLSLALDGRK